MLTDSLDLPPKLGFIFDEALRRIVEVTRPQAVILFGSYAEGRSRASSDLDLMVIADTGIPARWPRISTKWTRTSRAVGGTRSRRSISS